MIDPYTTYLMKDKEPVDIRRTPADLNEFYLGNGILRRSLKCW